MQGLLKHIVLQLCFYRYSYVNKYIKSPSGNFCGRRQFGDLLI